MAKPIWVPIWLVAREKIRDKPNAQTPEGFWRNDPRLRYAGGRTNGVAVAPNKVSGTRSMSRKLLA